MQRKSHGIGHDFTMIPQQSKVTLEKIATRIKVQMKGLTKIIGINVAGFQRRHCKLNSNNRRIRTCVTHGDNAKVIGPFLQRSSRC